MAGHHNPAVHLRRHGGQRQQIDAGLEYPHGRIAPLKETGIPFSVQNIVRDKQNQDPGSRPLVGCLPPELIAHEKEKRQEHTNIHRHLPCCLCLHPFPPAVYTFPLPGGSDFHFYGYSK